MNVHFHFLWLERYNSSGRKYLVISTASAVLLIPLPPSIRDTTARNQHFPFCQCYLEGSYLVFQDRSRQETSCLLPRATDESNSSRTSTSRNRWGYVLFPLVYLPHLPIPETRPLQDCACLYILHFKHVSVRLPIACLMLSWSRFSTLLQSHSLSSIWSLYYQVMCLYRLNVSHHVWPSSQ